MLIRYEGFDHQAATADLYAGILTTLVAAPLTNGQTAGLVLDSSTQYNIGKCLGVTATNPSNGVANAYAVMPLQTVVSECVVGAAIRLNSSLVNATVLGFSNLYAGQVYCHISAGSIRVFRGSPTGTSTQLGATVSSAVPATGWAFVEIKADTHTSTGSVQVRVNGVVVLTVTGVNTSADLTENIDGILLGSINSANTAQGAYAFFDDIYVCDTSGSSPHNDFLGPVRVLTQFPTANGSFADFVGTAHHPNWQQVNEPGMDSDSTYNESSTTGHTDTFVTSQLPNISSTVFGVKVVGAARLDDSGYRTIGTVLKSGSTTIMGTGINPSGSYRYFWDTYATNPSTSGLWTSSAVNLLEFGYSITPTSGTAELNSRVAITPAWRGQVAQSVSASASASIGRVNSLTAVEQQTTATASIGTIALRATFVQVNLANATSALSIGRSITATGGLLMSMSKTVGQITSSTTLIQSNLITAASAIVPAVSSTIGSGIDVAARIGVFPTASGVLNQVNLTTVSAALRPGGRGVFLQSRFLSGNIRVASFGASATLTSSVQKNIFVGLAAWETGITYTSGQRVSRASNAYQCITGGTSSGGPSGTASSITDGTAVWKFLALIDYTTLQAWANGIPATLTQPVVGLLWNTGTIVIPDGATSALEIGTFGSPRTTSTLNTITLKAAPGESLRDALPDGSTALAFNPVKGASITFPNVAGGWNYIVVNDSNVIIDGLQFRDPYSASNSTLLQQSSQCNNLVIRNCVFDGYAQPGGAVLIEAGSGKFTMSNCLVVDRQTSSVSAFSAAMTIQSANNTLVNNTFVGRLATGSNNAAIVDNSSAAIIRNCVFAGYAAAIVGEGGPIALVDHCLFSGASAGDAAVIGTGNLFSKAASAQFVSTTTDFRLKAGADALNAAINDLTNNPDGDDIARKTRPSGLWDIGAYEL